jgi:hypothetical protein
MPSDGEDLVRIEGVRGSNPLSSTEFLQVRWPAAFGLGVKLPDDRGYLLAELRPVITTGAEVMD